MSNNAINLSYENICHPALDAILFWDKLYHKQQLVIFTELSLDKNSTLFHPAVGPVSAVTMILSVICIWFYSHKSGEPVSCPNHSYIQPSTPVCMSEAGLQQLSADSGKKDYCTEWDMLMQTLENRIE